MEKRPLGKSAEVADYLGIPERTLEQWRWQKKGPRWSKVGRYVRYRWSDVEAWLDAQASTQSGS